MSWLDRWLNTEIELSLTRDLFRWIGFLIGGLYGLVALNNHYIDFYDILLKFGVSNLQPLLNYPTAIGIHGIIGAFIALLIKKIFFKKKRLSFGKKRGRR